MPFEQGTSASLSALPDLVERVRPAVVHVEASGGETDGGGSGFAIASRADDDPCVIVTVAHVVRDASRVNVRFYDDTEHRAEVRLRDESTDLAFLRVPSVPIRTLELRPLAEVRLGELVMAIGSPYGLEGSITLGIVSGLDRTMPAPNRVPIDNMIQTDALINPGNSGGPLIGLDGLVVGVNAQSGVGPEPGSSGLAFAIPGETVRLLHDEICETGQDRVVRATLAASTTLRPFTFEERERWRQRAGALVVHDPQPGTPAEAAGLRRGDVIVSFDGCVVDEPGDLYRLLDRRAIGRKSAVEYIRDGERLEASVVPRERA